MKAGALAQEDLSATVTRDKQRKMKVTVTRDKGTKAPKVQDDGKPLFVAPNIEWQQKGRGWDCRENYYEGKRRRRRVLGHLGRARYEEMRANSTDVELSGKLAAWVEERRFEKGVAELGGKAEPMPLM